MVPVLAVITVGAVALGAHQANAQEITSGYSSIASKLAEKFGLNQEDVQAVFTQDREERQAQMETQFEQRLTDAVLAGNLTEEQKQAILAKHQELQTARQTERDAERQDWQNMTQEERQTAMEERRTEMAAHRQALQTWADQQGIDQQYLFGLVFEGKGGPGGMGRHGMMVQ